jgi:pseudouridine synthase
MKTDQEPARPVPPAPRDAGKTRRLNQILSLAGLTSRRKADAWIKAGRVTVNGHPVSAPGVKAVWGVDRIQVDGQEIPGPSERLYLMLNKPFGYVSSLSDPQGRPLVTDLLRDIPQRVYPVGRLDFDTLGLLLLTNDGDWAHRLTHPRYRVPRTYKVTVAGPIPETALTALSTGVRLEDGRFYKSIVSLVSRTGKQSLIRMTLMRGKSRQVRRMLEATGSRVVHLIRTHYGNLALGDLKVGEYRHLEMEEVAGLNKLVGLERGR